MKTTPHEYIVHIKQISLAETRSKRMDDASFRSLHIYHPTLPIVAPCHTRVSFSGKTVRHIEKGVKFGADQIVSNIS